MSVDHSIGGLVSYLNENAQPVADPPDRPRLPEAQEEVVIAAENLLSALSRAGSSRELSLAKTNTEQALMWANNHFQKENN